MKPRVGQALASTVDATTVIVVRWPADTDLDITCGGAPMVDGKDSAAGGSGPVDPQLADGTKLGKRYADPERGVELLCTKPGEGSLAVDGAALAPKEAVPLPASD